MTNRNIVVLGAGAVGVCTALFLQQRGMKATLIDRQPPASETSGGNAGVISPSPLLFNMPGLWRQLPGLLLHGGAVLHVDIAHALTNLPWFARFMWHATTAKARTRAEAMHLLVSRGGELHRQLLPPLGAAPESCGWLKCYRSEKSYAAAKEERELLTAFDVAHSTLSAEQICQHAPALRPVFARATFLHDALAVRPQKAICAYADAFCQQGGRLLQAECVGLEKTGDSWRVKLQGGGEEAAAQVVVALGPWSKEFLRPMGIKLPINFERGGNRHFAAADNLLPCPIADMDGGYVMGMQEQGVRITSGICFSESAAPLTAQLNRAEALFREALPVAGEKQGADWHGARPTTPDCLPLIGPLKSGIWLATAHQHLGITTAPSTAEHLANWMTTAAPTPAALPFHPRRYNL